VTWRKVPLPPGGQSSQPAYLKTLRQDLDVGQPNRPLGVRGRDWGGWVYESSRVFASLLPFLLIVVTGLTTSWFLFRMLPTANAERAWSFLISIFAGTAILDLAVGQWTPAWSRGRQAFAATSLLAKLIPILAVATIPVSVLGASITFSRYPEFEWQAFAACAAVVGVITGAVGFIAAHELIHRTQTLDRAIGACMLTLCCYPCFFRAHIYGHHQTVGTADDPATARPGESIYRFLPRAIIGTAKNAWRIEQRLLADRDLGTWSTRNVTLWLWALSLFVVVYLGTVHSVVAAGFFVTQSAVAIAVLETINYVQHYGLVRQHNADGVLEPIAAKHSFNAPYWFSNVSFLNLLLHSDHHLHPRRPFPILRLDDTAPVLPLPAFSMIIIAYLPPVWFALMNDRAARANAG